MSFRLHIDNQVRTVSRSTSEDLASYRRYVGNITLVDIKQHFGLDFSIATLYTAFSRMKIPVDPMKLAKYYCSFCDDKITVLFPFYGTPYSMMCPHCSVSMRRSWICSAPFYYPSSEDFFFNGNQLVSVCHPEFKSDVESHLGIWNKSYPSFQADEKQTYHIVQSFMNWKPWFFCGNSGRDHSKTRIVSGLSSTIQIERVCPICMQEVISVWRNGGTIAPSIVDPTLSKREIAIKLFFDTKHLGSINSACAKNNKSRRTYYRMKRQYLSEYNTILGVKQL